MALTILTQPPILVLAKQPVVFTLHSDVTETPLRIVGAVVGIGGDSVQADSAGNASFDFSDYLKNIVTQRGKTASSPSVYSEVPLQVWFVFDERVGNPPETMPYLESTAFLLLDAYIPKWRIKSFYAANTNLLAYLISSKSCLTWWPVAEEKKVLPTQMECINFLQVCSATPITVKLDLSLWFTDGSYKFEQDIDSVPNVAYGQIVYFATGYEQIGVAGYAEMAYPDKTLLSYSVNLATGNYNTDNRISAIYSYLPVFDYIQTQRVLVFINPFGFYEYLLCTGLSDQENSIKPETAVTDGLALPDKLNWKTTKSDVVKVNTGFLTQVQMQWLSDLLESIEAYELIGTVMHPIVLSDVKLLVSHDADFQYYAELEYEYAYTQHTEQA
ncbi:MAG: hypothetical protein ACOYN4_00490 [Bacteroidales bacterium]